MELWVDSVPGEEEGKEEEDEQDEEEVEEEEQQQQQQQQQQEACICTPSHLLRAFGGHETGIGVDVKVILTPPCIFCIEN
jgi:hypothetical protein